jgi:hypothetical protein
MHHRDRRVGARVAFPVFLDQYVGDRRFRALATDVSESGIFVHQVAGRRPRGKVCALEIELPGLGETIWARGGTVDGHGIALTGMARSHARMLRAYCVEARRRQLADLLARIRC